MKYKKGQTVKNYQGLCPICETGWRLHMNSIIGTKAKIRALYNEFDYYITTESDENFVMHQNSFISILEILKSL